MAIEVLNETAFDVDIQRVMTLGKHLYTNLHIHPASELAVVFVDNDAMSQLHQDWMGLDGPTDVMSFPMDELRPGTQQQPAQGLLGDIVISPEVAAEHAARGGHNVADEVALLVTHGLLHLLGYDHDDPEEKDEMFSLQNRLLQEFLGYAPPELQDEEA
ncbi:rRNA maturation RNase YbeY [Enteractinococcus helveticum]|uniref:Endoribonuclease YbeY n=1 Tax=Enteractinococcus helveticum TaxID=1837282 RepID=A0A1B7LZL0_9MICC|nr:rRNA maturation RNase YbeY [Enteractinococcus helveticum]OAV60939.1 rRNA maturation RNase YbeY [Enteractinococcus helveticum]